MVKAVFLCLGFLVVCETAIAQTCSMMSRDSFNSIKEWSEKAQQNLENQRCPGLPEVRDKESNTEQRTALEASAHMDFLMHAECSNSFKIATCKPLKASVIAEKSPELAGGLVASTARFAAQSLPDALAMDRRVSDLTQQAPGKFKGLCDVFLMSDYAIKQVEECLKMPGMVGVGELQLNGGAFGAKSDDPEYQLKSKGKTYERFTAIANLIQKKGGGALLVHFNNSQQKYSAAETRALLEVAQKFPKVNFVVLHSGETQVIRYEGVKQIGQHYKMFPNSPKNIWLDLSTNTDAVEAVGSDPCAIKKRQAEQAQVWREFGTERVAFGSDTPLTPEGLGNPQGSNRYVKGLIANPYLSVEEKRQMLSGNLKKMMQGL